jgi:peroxiredoxin
MSVKRLLAATVALATLVAIAYLGVRIYEDASAQRAAKQRIQTLPPFALSTLDGHPLHRHDLSRDRPVVLVYFDTECQFCQTETRSLVDYRALRDTAHVLMVSPEPAPTLRSFVRDVGLDAAGITVARDPDGTLAARLGITRVPNTLAYGADRRLVTHFEGEASAPMIYAALTRQSSPASSNTPAASASDCAVSSQLATASDADCANGP